MPAGSGKYTIAVGHLWVGGYDAGGTLKLAAQTYRQSGTDYFFGPLNSSGIYDPANDSNMNRVWKIDQYDIDTYYNWVMAGEIGLNPVDSPAMEVINNWPAFNIDGTTLAPFNDINMNGAYEPELGEHPLIKGDQAIFFLFTMTMQLFTQKAELRQSASKFRE